MLVHFRLMMVAIVFAIATTSNASVEIKAAGKKDISTLDAISKKYRTSPLITMAVSKDLKLGLLGQERKSTGQISISQGRMRMELAGDEKSLLVINKSDLWGVTFPSEEMKESPPQVIHGKMSSTQLRAQALLGILSNGAFTTQFQATGMSSDANGLNFYLQPRANSNSAVKRLEVLVSKDKKKILAIHFWDDRENETTFQFDKITFGKKKAPEKTFQYSPPPNTDVMQI